jgi:hypothetical protein
MIGQDAIGFHAVGEGITTSAAPLVYEPVSRVMAGGFSNGRPVQVAVLGAYIVWDNGDYIVWDNGDYVAWG